MNAANFTTEDLQSLHTTVERFGKQAIAPHVPAWEEAGQIDRSLYTQAARRLDHAGRAHQPRQQRGQRHLDGGDAGRHTGHHAHTVAQDGLAQLRHSAAAL